MIEEIAYPENAESYVLDKLSKKKKKNYGLWT